MKERVCGCGHEESWHQNSGPCSYGCGCEGFHSRRTRELEAVARASDLNAPRARRDAGSLELATSALRSLDRAQDAINDARKKLQAIILKEARIQGPPIDAGDGVPLHVKRARDTMPAPALVLEQPTTKPLGRCERALLAVLASRAGVTTNRMQLSVLSEYSSSSSSFANGIGRLRSLGFIAGQGAGFAVTESGKAEAGSVAAVPPAGARLVAYWSQVLGRCELSLLGALVDAYPKLLSREEVAGRAGYSPTSSSVANALGRLRSLELIDGPRFSEIRASPSLVDEPVRIGKCDLCNSSGKLRPVPGFGANLHCERCAKEITEAAAEGGKP